MTFHTQYTDRKQKSMVKVDSPNTPVYCVLSPNEYGQTIKSPLKLNRPPDYHTITFVSFRSNCRIPSLRLAPLPGIRIKRIHVQCM